MNLSDNLNEFARLCGLSVNSGTLKNIVFSSNTDGDVLKIKGTLKKIRDEIVVQFEYYLTEGRVKQENVCARDIDIFIRETAMHFHECYLNDTNAQVSLRESKKGKESLVKKGKIGKGESIELAVKTRNSTISREMKNFLLKLAFLMQREESMISDNLSLDR